MIRNVINALGCNAGGGAIIARLLHDSSPRNTLWFACQALDSGSPLHGTALIKLGGRLLLYWLRPLVELFLALAAFLLRANYINLSNYGFMLGRGCLLIHNPFLLCSNAEQGFGAGRPNVVSRFMLNQSLANCDTVFVQSDAMVRLLMEYCVVNDIPMQGRIALLRLWPIDAFSITNLRSVRAGGEGRTYAFQFFYPASSYAHKRVDLAVNGLILASKAIPEVGLVYTSEPIAHPSVCGLGFIDRQSVLRRLAVSDCLLFTSEAETFGLPLYEALALGVPAVLPNLPYAREVYGDAAIYFDTFTVASVSSAITKMHAQITEYRGKALSRRSYMERNCLSPCDAWRVLVGVGDRRLSGVI